MGGGASKHIEEPVWKAVDWKVSGVVNGGVHIDDIRLFIWFVAPQDGCSPIVQLLNPFRFDAITLADGYGGGDVPLDGFVSFGGFVVLFFLQGSELLLQNVNFLFPIFTFLFVQF